MYQQTSNYCGGVFLCSAQRPIFPTFIRVQDSGRCVFVFFFCVFLSFLSRDQFPSGVKQLVINPCRVMDVNLPCFLCCVLRPLPLCTKIVDERLCLVVAIYGGASDFWGLVMAVIAVMALWTGSGCCIHMEAHGTTAEDW